MSESFKMEPARQVSIPSSPSDSLLDEQNASWQEGRRITVEELLERSHSLGLNEECLLDLLYNEIRLRDEAGDTPTLEEYQQRFPQFGDALRVQFQVHEAMRPGEALAEFPSEEDADSGPLPLPTISGFEVLSELGRGAMGVVYKARHLRLNRLAALKMILAGVHAGSRERARFETEARAVARLQHPHIVQIHEVGEQDGRPFLCMELVPGGNLAEILTAGPLPFGQAAELAEVLARAVHHAHEQQIVHRDLKPANVLLTPSDARRGIKLGTEGKEGYFEPKITDFGLAKSLDQPADATGGSGTGGPMGTPPYMAPEQAGQSPSDAYGKRAGNGRATDVYALGAVLYEMLTGRPPFLAATVYDTLQQVMTLDPVPPRRLQPHVPRDLEAICLACLRKEPRRRYATALDLADDLRRYLEGKPIRQRLPAPWEPALKWAKRRPAAAAWIVLGLAGLLGLVAGGLYYLEHRREWARQDALDRYERFLKRRDEALFQGTLLTAIGMASRDQAGADLHATQESAREALRLAGVSVEGETGPGRAAHLTALEQSSLTNSCYELLLVLAQATGQPLPGMTPEEQQEQAAEGLHILDRAGQLGSPTRAFHLCQARLLALRGDHTGSAAARQQAEALQPVSASDFYLTGVDQYQEGDTARALRSFHDALHLQPNHFEAQCFLAICSLDAGRPGEARIGLTACIGLRPHFAWSYLLRGVAAVQEQAYADAEADFATAQNLDKGDLMGFTVRANRGRALLRQGKLEEAIADLQKAAALRPQECQAYVLLAQAFQRRKQYAEADHALETALRLRPDLPVVHRTRAEVLWERGELDDALRQYDKTIALECEKSTSPLLADDYVARGRIRHAQGRFADAVAAYDDALRISPKLARAHYFRGESLLALNRFPEAEQAFGECLRNGPPFGPAFRSRGLARVRQGRFAGAVEDYTEALHQERDASILEHLGWAYFFTDAWKLAEQNFEESIKLNGKPGDAHVGRGLARVMLGDYRRAVADAETLLSANKPDTPEMMHNVACTYALAAARVKTDSAEKERETLEKRYRQRAVAALGKALLLVPADKRFDFWQEKMRPDSALDAIRPSAEFIDLDDQLRKEFAPKQEGPATIQK
jgi:serine/threonine protein kinase/Flp pilus assembly protein TadD